MKTNKSTEIKKAIKAAWPHTIPVFAGYIFLGIAFGFLAESKNYPVWYPILMSVIIYAGSLEFAAIPFIGAAFDPIGSFVMAFMLSARQLFYGIPMLKKYENAGKLKPLLIYTLTDETFSISSTVDAPEGVNSIYFFTAISLFDYSYWVIGTTIGAVFGNLLTFDSTGIDFALTALFIVLFVEQIKTNEGKKSGAIGLVSTAFVLAVFGSSNLVVISMVVILAALLLGRRKIENE